MEDEEPIQDEEEKRKIVVYSMTVELIHFTFTKLHNYINQCCWFEGTYEWLYPEWEASTLKDGERVLTGKKFMCKITYRTLNIAKETVLQLAPVLVSVITEYAYM
jgi:hypothetical protein